jgi:hypothetical protein
MKQQFPQITRRRIGSVVILDIKGELVGPWALRAKDNIAKLMSENIKHLIINVKELSTIDSLGVKAISENLNPHSRNALISGKISVMEMFSRLHALDDIKVLNDENAVIDFFGKEFVDTATNLHFFDEKRIHQRLKTAIPLEFWYEDTNKKKIVFKAIITDLSKGGFMAEYLDLETVDTINQTLDPYDLKMLELKIKLPGHDYIYASGKVLRTVITGEQLGLGVEFYRISDVDISEISKFLE